MGACLSCGGGEPHYDQKVFADVQPVKAGTEGARVTADSSSGWPSTDQLALHPDATFADSNRGSFGAESPAGARPVELDTTISESSMEIGTPSPTVTKTPGGVGGDPSPLPDKAELMRTPAGPLESSPSAASTASSTDAAARNKTVSSLFDRAAGQQLEQGGKSGDFDIPAVRSATSQGGTFRAGVTAELADLPLSNFKSRQPLRA